MRSFVLGVFLVWLVPFWFFLFLRVCLSSLVPLVFGSVCSFSLVAFAPVAPSPPCVFWETWYGFPRRLLPPLLPTASGGVVDLATFG